MEIEVTSATFQRLADRKRSTVTKKGRRERVSFGIVHYASGNMQSYLVIPANTGVSKGDRISFYIEERGISFRIEEDGVYPVGSTSSSSKVLRCGLCPDLADFAGPVIRSIFVMQVPGGWLVPFSQFD